MDHTCSYQYYEAYHFVVIYVRAFYTEFSTFSLLVEPQTFFPRLKFHIMSALLQSRGRSLARHPGNLNQLESKNRPLFHGSIHRSRVKNYPVYGDRPRLDIFLLSHELKRDTGCSFKRRGRRGWSASRIAYIYSRKRIHSFPCFLINYKVIDHTYL